MTTHSIIFAAVVVSIIIVYTFAPTIRAESTKPRETTVGLRNVANDCFANSVLQALSASPTLRAYVTLHADRNLTGALKLVLDELCKPITRPKAISPWPFLHVLERVYNSRISRSQHDAHELLHLVLETVDEENKDTEKAVPFKGLTVDRITCDRCGNATPARHSSFLVLTLAVPQQAACDLDTCLASALNRERISDYACQSCGLRALAAQHPDRADLLELDVNAELPAEVERMLPTVKSTIVRSTALAALPDVLFIHLSRSIFDIGATRNSCHVSYPENLTLYTSFSAASLTSVNSKTYKLVALVRHRGTHSAGHYECYKRRTNTIDITRKNTHKTKGWWRISDETVWPCSTAEVLNQAQYAYLLIYEKQDNEYDI